MQGLSDYSAIDGDIYYNLLPSETYEKLQKFRQKEITGVQIERNLIKCPLDIT